MIQKLYSIYIFVFVLEFCIHFVVMNNNPLLPLVQTHSNKNEDNQSKFRGSNLRDFQNILQHANPIKFGMPREGYFSSTICAPNSPNWNRYGRNAEISYILAVHTGNRDMCVQVGDGMMLENGTLVGGMKDLIEGTIDMYGAPLDLEVDLIDIVDFFYTHHQDNLCLMVQRAPHKQRMILLSLPFTFWWTTAACLLLFTIVFRIGFRREGSRAVFEVTRTFLTGTLDSRYRRLMVWLSVFCFFMSNTFAGSFTGFLIIPGHENEIDTLVEVNKTIRYIYGFPQFISRLRRAGESDGLVASLSQRITFGNGVEHAATSRDAAILWTATGLEWMERLPGYNDGGYSLFHHVRECVLSPSYYVFPVRKHWILTEYFSALVQRLVETGFMQKFHAVDLVTWTKKFNLVNVAKGVPPPTTAPLYMRHFRELYVMWGFGMSVGALTLLLEYLWVRCYQWQKSVRTRRNAWA